MKKIITVFLIFFISFVYSVSSLKTFEVNETEKISLGLKAEDPDADRLIYTFTEPLDKNGEWQTNYGDAGEYASAITVSDGENEISEEVLIVVKRKEAVPIIDKFLPKESSLTIAEGKSIKFRVDASDLNNDKLTYIWSVNDEAVSENNEMLFGTGYDDAGEHIIKVILSDGIFNASKEWNVKVNDVDINGMLEQIKGITVLETEKAGLELPDFKKYGLSYEISEPLGNGNSWQTGYDDAGEYTVKITANGRGFEGEKDVKVTVKNNDRAPEFIGLNGAAVNENEQLKIELKAVDPDNDNIIFSVEDAPKDAGLDGNAFVFNPGYDFVQKNNAFDYVLDKFRILSRSINVIFTAESNGLSDMKSARITVKDVNRPFILEGIGDIEVNEGGEIVIEPKYNDPDKDRVSFSYSGFMDSSRKKTGFDDVGEYVVKIVASDGYNTETKFVNVKVNDVNRKPVFEQISNVEVSEGNEARIELKASDPDNDAVRFSAINMPEGAELRDNLFVWKPDFDAVNGTKKDLLAEFAASDGKDEAEKKVKIIISNVNQAPRIANFSNTLIAVKNQPILFEINAVDIDGDELAYEWNFGFFNKYKGESKHQRVFTTKGTKEVKVTVSDGIESVKKIWNVEVV